MSNIPTRVPPPPPPRTSDFGWDRLEPGEEEEEEEEQEPRVHEEEEIPALAMHAQRVLEEIKDTAPRREYLLSIKFPSSTLHHMSPSYEGNTIQGTAPKSRRMDTVQIQVYPQMNADLLAQCVCQAVSQAPNSDQGFFSPLVGVFGEQDRIFHSFEHILSMSDPSWQAYSTVQPQPIMMQREKPSPTESPHLWLGGAAVGVFLGSFAYGDPQSKILYYLELVVYRLLGTLFRSFHSLHELVFNLPFRELYRHGPHVIGWEGLALAEVCNRITHFGGREFWVRNMSECEEIYAGKEEAFLRTVRPVVYFLLCIISFYVVRHLVAVYGESKRNRTDRSVLEAYHAFQTLVRIANRQNFNGVTMDPSRGHRR